MMGTTIAINNLYMAKMPNSCKECPLTYLDTGDDAYFGANERRCVIDDSCVDGMVSERAYDCPLVEAIPKADYEARLKADTTEKFKEFRDKLSKWMFHNSESVCGCSMIDIDYLEGHMDELLYELGIYGEGEDVND